MRYFYNDRSLRDRRRELRKNMTESEIFLWDRLRKRRMKGYKFLRQYSAGPYILDFFCVKLRLGIEVDGRFHADNDQAAYDQVRSEFLMEHGIKLMRFWNHEILHDIETVLDQINKETALIDISPLEEGEKEGLSD